MITTVQSYHIRLAICGLLLSICSAGIMSFRIFDNPSSDRINYFNESGPDVQGTPEIAPVDLDRVTAIVPYGERIHPQTNEMRTHTGVDFEISEGADVVATASGTIEFVKYDNARGTHILIKHGDVYSTQYSHLSAALVKQGQQVVKGQVIGSAGNSGLSARPHLHYEIFENGNMVDPKGYLPKLPG